MHRSYGLQHLRHKRLTFASSDKSGYTLGFRRRIAHSGLHAETGGVSDGGGITTLRAFRTFTNIPGPGIRTAYFAAFGSWPGVLPKNAESLRDFGWGAIITLDTYCTFTNIPGPGTRTACFAAFGAWSGVLPKNAEILRDSDALMRVAVPRRRGPAGLRDLFSLLSKL